MASIHPDDDSKPFIARFNALVRILLVEASVKGVARAVMADYADFNDGSNCYPSNERLARETGYSERTIRFAWSVMRGLGMAERVGFAVPHRGRADDYTLRIPTGWRTFAILGPNGRKFHCVYCSRVFNPQGNCSVNSQPGDKPGADIVRWDLVRMVFCPEPRKVKGRQEPSCFQEWTKERRRAGAPTWDKLGADCWDLFREARADEWSATPHRKSLPVAELRSVPTGTDFRH